MTRRSPPITTAVGLLTLLSACGGAPPVTEVPDPPQSRSFVHELSPRVVFAAYVPDFDRVIVPILDAAAQMPDSDFAPSAECDGRWNRWIRSAAYAMADGRDAVMTIEGSISERPTCAAALPGFDEATRQGERLITGDATLLSGRPSEVLQRAAETTSGASVEAWIDVQGLLPADAADEAASIAGTLSIDANVVRSLVEESLSIGVALRTESQRALEVHLVLPTAFAREAAIETLNAIRDRAVAQIQQEVAGPQAGTPMGVVIDRIIAMVQSVRFRAEPTGIVADVDASFDTLMELPGIIIPAFANYARASKAAEAQSMLRNLFTYVAAYYAASGTVPGGAGPIPPVPIADKQLGDFASNEVFFQLGFTPVDPLYYSYSIIATDDPNQVILRAEGDLDGDGERSRIELTITCEPTNGCARSEFREESPLE